MLWYDNLEPCTLAGIDCLHKSSTVELGRRTVTYTFPFRDVSKALDVGRLPAKLQERLFFVGDDFQVQVQRFWQALEQPGPYTYVHPYWGAFRVAVDGSVKVSQTEGKLAYAEIDITLVQVDETTQFRQFTPTAAVRDASALVEDAAAEDFEANFDANALLFVDLINDAVDRVREAQDFIAGINGDIAIRLNAVSDLTNAVQGLHREVAELINTPNAVASQLRGLINAGLGIVSTVSRRDARWSPSAQVRDRVAALSRPGRPSSSATSTSLTSPNAPAPVLVDAMRRHSKFETPMEGIPEPPEATPQRMQQRQNYEALQRFVRTQAVASVCRQVSATAWGSVEQVDQFSAFLRATVDDILLDEAITDATFHALTRLAAASDDYLYSTAQRLPAVERHTVRSRRSSILVAYELFGDANLEHRLFERNLITRPGRIPAGTEIEVLGG